MKTTAMQVQPASSKGVPVAARLPMRLIMARTINVAGKSTAEKMSISKKIFTLKPCRFMATPK